MKAKALAGLAAMVVLTACQAQPKTSSVPAATGKSASLQTMERVAIAAYQCWFGAKDPAFRSYRLANELNSFSGTPRLLLVPAKDYGARPLLVIQAQGNSAAVETFGPLMVEPLGSRVGADVRRWAGGDGSCGTPA